VSLLPLAGVTLTGGLAGSLLLLWTPAAAFTLLLPWLLLFATLALAFGPSIGGGLRRRLRHRAGAVLAAQFALGIYGGYFGGAVGLMMLALWNLLGESDPKSLNGARTLLVSAANTVAVLTFALIGAV
jgi:uncharacterized membrane protein YfcA